jgi:surfactin family lipopeptide synthetase A
MVVTSGEALSKETVKNWYQLAAVPLHNLYGPTEASIEVTHYSVSAADTQILIGQPIRNIQIYITGKCGQLSRVGIAGEICIGGVGVARGYLNKAALTAAHFVDNPFGEGKLYKTGDLGKWLPDGNIAFLGRKDEQVKIRGYRIEPGEIEAVLQGYETIESAVVLARANEEGEKELVAYVVAKETLNSTEIRSFMSKRLPAYMVPGHFVQLSVFPLTASGKVDRKRLPDPGSNGMETDTAYRAPGNEREQQLLVVWQEILGKEKIGTRDNFFELGGHSLSVIKMVRILNKKYGILLKIQDIYNHPTIEALAAREQENSTMFRLSIHNNPAKRNIYFIPPVIGNAVMFMPLSDHLRDLFNCYGFQYKGLEKDEALHLSVENMAQEFSDEIIRQQTDEEFLIVGYSMGVPIAFEMIRILEQQFSKVKLMLVDRGVSDRHAGAHTANTLRNDVEWLAERYKEQVSAEHTDEAALTRFLTNNVQVLGKYRQSGVIKSNIHTFECAGNKVNTCMGEWNKYTVGEASHHWLNGGHWDAFSRENLPRFKQVITDIFREN